MQADSYEAAHQISPSGNSEIILRERHSDPRHVYVKVITPGYIKEYVMNKTDFVPWVLSKNLRLFEFLEVPEL